MYNEIIDTEYIILENIYDSTELKTPLRQRDLAQIAGASLGLTNSILKRLAKKGLITIKKLNSRNIQYAVTLEGFNEIIHRSYHYFKRTIRNAVYYKESLDEAIHRAERKNLAAVILVGASDLDFIVEHTCHRYGLSFLKAAENDTVKELESGDALVIYAESIGVKPQSKVSSNTFYLSKLVMRQASEVRE